MQKKNLKPHQQKRPYQKRVRIYQKKFRLYLWDKRKLSKKLYWHKRLAFRLQKLQYKRWPFIRKRLQFNALFSYRINIRVTGNNVYCTLVNPQTNKIILAASAGTLRVKTSVKLLKKYSLNRILSIFFKRVRKTLTNARGLLVFLTVPIKSRKKVLRHVAKLRTYRQSNRPELYKAECTDENRYEKEKVRLGSRRVLIKFFSRKIFNGCRVKKTKRKKKNRKLRG